MATALIGIDNQAVAMCAKITHNRFYYSIYYAMHFTLPLWHVASDNNLHLFLQNVTRLQYKHYSSQNDIVIRICGGKDFWKWPRLCKSEDALGGKWKSLSTSSLGGFNCKSFYLAGIKFINNWISNTNPKGLTYIFRCFLTYTTLWMMPYLTEEPLTRNESFWDRFSLLVHFVWY